jgi:hypothetical protein
MKKIQIIGHWYIHVKNAIWPKSNGCMNGQWRNTYVDNF